MLYARRPEAWQNFGWTTIVMHNRHEAGYWQLGANSGGLEPGEPEFVYPGHRPYFLILPYLLKELPGAAGGNGLLYDFTVLGLTYGALLWLLGAHLRGLLVAGIVCMSHGFMNNIAGADTIGVPAMLGIAAVFALRNYNARHPVGRSGDGPRF